MSLEAVVSIVESAAQGGGVTAILIKHSSPAYQALLKHRWAMEFFKNFPKFTANWVTRIQFLQRTGSLVQLAQLVRAPTSIYFEAAMAKLAAEEAFVTHAARMAAANAAATAAEGTLVAGAGTTAAAVILPVVAMAAVGVALGAPYYQAREQAKKEEYASGFAKGFITGILQWEVRFTIDRFWDNTVSRHGFDDMMPTIRAAAQNKGLLEGRIAGLAKTDHEKKQYLNGLRKLTKTSTTGWNPQTDDWRERMRARQVQISYVIDLATAAMKHGVIQAE